MKHSMSKVLLCLAWVLFPAVALAQNPVTLPQRIVINDSPKALYKAQDVHGVVGVGVGSDLRIVGVEASLTLVHQAEQELLEASFVATAFSYCWIDQNLLLDFPRAEICASETARQMAGNLVEGIVCGEIITVDSDGREYRIPFCGSDWVEVVNSGA